jgi:hypothetical protein
MEKWPALPPCTNCPWRDRLLKRRSFAGFFVRANMMSFSYLSNEHNDPPFPHAEIATLYPIAKLKSTTTITEESVTISKSDIEGIPSPLQTAQSISSMISIGDHGHAPAETKTIKGIYGIASSTIPLRLHFTDTIVHCSYRISGKPFAANKYVYLLCH